MPLSDTSFDIIAEVFSNVLLFLLVFGMSATVNSKKLIEQLHNKYAVGIGLLMQFVVMPFLGFVSLKSLGERMSSTMGIILLVVMSSPGGSYSNWYCSLFNADLALSVAMTALSTIFSAFLLPINLILFSYATYGSSRESILNSINWGTLFTSLTIVIVAIFSGLLASNFHKSKKFRRWANRFGSISGVALVVFSALINALTENDENGSGNGLFEQNWEFYLGVSLPCVLGLILSNILSYIANLSHPERVTLSVECCYQNVGIATSVAVAMFDDKTQRAEALGVPLLYGMVEAIVLSLYCLFAWKQGWTKAPSDEKICNVVVNSYEISSTDDDFSDSSDLTDDELDTAMDGESKLQHINNLKELKKRGQSEDTTTTISSTTCASPRITNPEESQTSTNERVDMVETIICCSSPNISAYSPVDSNQSARRRTSPYIEGRKEFEVFSTTKR